MCCSWCFLTRSSVPVHPQGYATIRINCQQEIKVFLGNLITMGIWTCMNGQEYGENPRIFAVFFTVHGASKGIGWRRMSPGKGL